METITIDLRGTCPSHELHARMVWQQLFNIYRESGGDIGRLDNMLIDYTRLCEWLKNPVNPAYWCLSGSWTTDFAFKKGDCIFDDGYKITRLDDSIIIEPQPYLELVK